MVNGLQTKSVKTAIYTLLVMLYPALALSTAHGSGAIQACLLIMAVVSATRFNALMHAYEQLSNDAKLFSLLFMVSVLLESFIIAVHGYTHPALHSPLLRLVAIVSLITIAGLRIRARYFWLGIVFGAFAVLATAVYQRFYLHIPRATGYHNAIHFGNFSLVLGLLSFVAFTQLKQINIFSKILLLSAALAGLITSLLSGSRGGWIALILSFIPIYTYSKPNYRKQLLWAILILLVLLVSIYLLPSLGFKTRLTEIYDNINAYLHGNPHTSIGYRFEMMRGSLNVALENPFWGIGDNFKLVMQEMARLGTVVPNANFNDTHNELIYAFLRGGVVGFLQLLILYIAPMLYFIKTAKSTAAQSNETLMALAVGGVVLTMATIDFGLSVNVFTRQIGKSFYFIMVIYLLGLCEIERRKASAPKIFKPA